MGLIVIVGCLLTACQKNEETPPDKSVDEPGYLAFDVNPALLGETFRDPEIGIMFNSPLNWRAIADSVVQADVPSTESSIFSIYPRKIFINDSLRCSLAVSRVDSVNINNTNQLLKLTETNFRMMDAKADIRQTEYYTKNFRVRQTLTMTDRLVFFRLLFDHPDTKIFQVDFVLPRDIYAGQAKTIESCIGSIRPTKT